ncbi:DUF427 domain-containing protein [Pseudonocardia sp. GCM10023141]|uniref:DUF427 domain-containing protein n=1 Tax=Pseudonocardia sp. GCM10023141 TaxID=3252653 RepID=UPI0036171561
MATRLADVLFQRLDELRYEPVQKRVRALLDGSPAVDSAHAVLIWEPRRVVPQYAVPVADVLGELLPAAPHAGNRHGPGGQPLGPGRMEVLTPDTGFGVHSAEGAPLTVRLGATERVGAAFRPDDPSLDGYVALDFDAFDTWLEEDEQIVSHPRDPFHRIDVRQSSRHVRIELDGHVLAESGRPHMLFETSLPARFYLPIGDVDTDLLQASPTTTACAYKGVATYLTATLSGRTVPDVAWSYPDPLPDAVQIADLVSFFTERVDLVLDGVAVERPITPWS